MLCTGDLCLLLTIQRRNSIGRKAEVVAVRGLEEPRHSLSSGREELGILANTSRILLRLQRQPPLPAAPTIMSTAGHGLNQSSKTKKKMCKRKKVFFVFSLWTLSLLSPTAFSTTRRSTMISFSESIMNIHY